MVKYNYTKTLSKFVDQWLETWYKIASTVFKFSKQLYMYRSLVWFNIIIVVSSFFG